MRIGVHTNTDEVLGDIDAFMAAIFVAAPRAANRLRDQAQTVGVRRAAGIYGVKSRDFAASLRTRDAIKGDAEASLTATGKAFPLSAFNPRQTKQGVTVKVKGRLVRIQHAFIARMRSGHVGVFARGAYGGKGATKLTGEVFGRFKYSKGRLPINELYTFAAADMLANEDVVADMDARVDEQQAKVLKSEIAFALREIGR